MIFVKLKILNKSNYLTSKKMSTPSYIKTKKHNTNYYRRNKLEKFRVHTCPHCNYKTTGPKQCIRAHIWAKHTPEHKKPFQCPCGDCNRGMASRANLKKHLKKDHDIILPPYTKKVLVYKITLKREPTLTKEYNRYKQYCKFILTEDIKNNKFSLDNIYYDFYKGYIDLTTYTREDLLRKFGNKVE